MPQTILEICTADQGSSNRKARVQNHRKDVVVLYLPGEVRSANEILDDEPNDSPMNVARVDKRLTGASFPVA
jgi:hypothetical protein